jgi:SAM-dependent methyltransferase
MGMLSRPLRAALRTVRRHSTPECAVFERAFMATRANMVARRAPTRSTRVPVPAAVLPMAEAHARLASRAPRAHAIWRELLEVNAAAYAGFPTHSCSVAGHALGRHFRAFCRPHLAGRVLDLGCGPQPVPLYLDDYPRDLVAGLDPLLPAAEPHPFLFVQGVAEFLPWPAGTFDRVIAATSLDHVLLLEDTLAEIHRVLAPGGAFLAWMGFVRGAKPYDPHSDSVAALDAYHLFHFDQGWFESLMRRYFEIDEVVHLMHPGESSFYALIRRGV